MAKIQEAIKKAAELIDGVLKEQGDNIEKGWNNAEEDQAFVVNMKVKFFPKDGNDIKVKIPYSFAVETIKDSAEATVSDQLPLPDGADGQ